MLALATDWVTLSSLATAAGTLVLAIATFAAVRSSNRSALIAEVALQEQRRPILVPSRLDDPAQKLNFADGHWVSAKGGHAAADHVNGNVYLGINVRNVGSGLGVCQGWSAKAGVTLTSQAPNHRPQADFHMQTRDLFIAGGDTGMWQGALRNPDDPLRAALAEAIDTGQQITIELLYSDLTGRQRAITRFGLLAVKDPSAQDPSAQDPSAQAPSAQDPSAQDTSVKRTWLASMSRHWFLDVDGPRPDSEELEQAIAVIRSETNTQAETTLSDAIDGAS
jgi:hypothetical protein